MYWNHIIAMKRVLSRISGYKIQKELLKGFVLDKRMSLVEGRLSGCSSKIILKKLHHFFIYCYKNVTVVSVHKKIKNTLKIPFLSMKYSENIWILIKLRELNGIVNKFQKL